MADERKPMANIPPFGLRMQPDLKARVEEAARENNRSLNAEIVARLERSFQTDRESADWDRLIAFYSADHRYIEDEYLKGRTPDPMSGVPTGKAETELVKQINRLISKRTEMMGEIIMRELEKKGMLVAPGVSSPPPRHVSPEEMKLLHEAPQDVMPEVLERLANRDVDGALLSVYKAKARKSA